MAEPRLPSEAGDARDPRAPAPGAPPIERITGNGPIREALRGGVVAIGNFDGVHRGHRTVLDAALVRARTEERPALVLTFEPHPRELFTGQRVPRLTPPRERALVLGLVGFDAVIEQPFDRALAALDPDAFVERILDGRLGASHVVVGHDFRYGAQRAGDAGTLRERVGGLDVVEPHRGTDGAIVSSSAIREALAEGEVGHAGEALGRRWRVSGEVLHGRKVGRTIGYPTANMALDAPDMLAHGIYAVRLRRADGTLHDGVASHGRRPTFDDGAPLLETHLFDFSGDLYGESVHVSLFGRLRGEERFDSVEALVAQMDRDSLAARAMLREAEPLGAIDRALSFPPGPRGVEPAPAIGTDGS